MDPASMRRATVKFRDPEVLRWAACRRRGAEDPDWNPELFFPKGETEPFRAQIEEAKAICAECPIRRGCLQWAVVHKEWGIWGGTTKKERDEMVRRKTARTAIASLPQDMIA